MNADDIIRRLSSQVQSITSALAQLARRVRRLEHLGYTGPGTGGDKHVIQNEGVSLPDRPVLDFVGDGVTASDTGIKTKIDIPSLQIQDKGVNLPKRSILNFIGESVSVYDELGTERTIVEILGGLGIVADSDFEKILWIPRGGSPISRHSVNQIGRDGAIQSAINSGLSGVIWVPPCSIPGAFTVPSNVMLASMGNRSIFTGKCTFSNGSGLKGVMIHVIESSADPIVAVEGPASGEAILNDTWVIAENTGAGNGYAISQTDAGALWAFKCILEGYAVYPALGYGAHRAGEGNIYINGGRCWGSTSPCSE